MELQAQFIRAVKLKLLKAPRTISSWGLLKLVKINGQIEERSRFADEYFVIPYFDFFVVPYFNSAFPHYVRHTNNKGLFSEQTTAKIAYNTVVLDESYIEILIA